MHAFDSIIVVYMSEQTQIQRLMQRDVLSLEDALKRIKAHMSLREKLKSADFVINNEGNLENTKKR